MVRGLLVLPALMLLLSACSRPPDETQIRTALEGMSAAVAEADARAFMRPLAEDFTADAWDLDRRGVRLLLLRELRAHQRARARLFDIEVELVGEDRAVARFQSVLTGGSGLIPEQGSWYRVETAWRRRGNDWQMINASWERIAGR